VPRSDQARLSSSFSRNAAVSYGERVVAVLSTLLVTPFLFRRLGVAGFGTWSVIFTLMTVFSLVELGFAAGVVKYVAEHRARDEHDAVAGTLRIGVGMLTLVGLASFGVCAAIGLLGSGLAAAGQHSDFRTAMLVLGAALAVRLPGAAYGAVLAGYQRFDLFSGNLAFTTIVCSIGAVVAVESGGGVLGVAAAYAVGLAAGGLLQIVLLAHADPSLNLRRGRVAGEERRPVLVFSSLALLADSMVFIGQRMDTVVVAAVRNAPAAAPLGAASKLQSGMQALTLPFINLLMPISSALSARGRTVELAHSHRLATRAALQISLPVAFVLALFSHDIVRVWLGPTAPAITASVITVLAIQTLFIAASPAEKILLGMGRARLVGILNTVEGLGNLGVSILLVAAYGTIGAAVGSLIASTLVGPLKWPLAARATNERLRSFLLGSIGTALASSVPAIVAMVALRVLLPPGVMQLVLGTVVGLGLAAAVAIVQIGPSQLHKRLRALVSRAPLQAPLTADRP
jgi:O-antigen/teichoic acid export membrane protein